MTLVGVSTTTWVKTTSMEMGQSPSVAEAEPAVWVNFRQYTGRVVTVTNEVLFNEPVYNYTAASSPTWARKSSCR